MRPWISALPLLFAFQTSSVMAHSGGLNAQGCHNNRKTGDYHCHSSPTTTNKQLSTQASSYSRSQFGNGWADLDSDCQDSRQEALISQSTNEVIFKDSSKCKVLQGRWISPYTGNVIYDASEIDIDHVVPLKWAWDHGASDWTRSMREAFANDPVNLWVVEASLNRQKGAKGLDQWLPPAGKCQYASRFLRLSRIYNLAIPQAVLDTQRNVCGQ